MAYSPICPECGSAAVEPVGDVLECQRCHHAARPKKFKRERARFHADDEYSSEDGLRRRGFYMETRTIGLSDE